MEVVATYPKIASDQWRLQKRQSRQTENVTGSFLSPLEDEMYEILSNLPAVAYTCAKCTEKHPAEWRTALKSKLQSSVLQVLMALLNSRTSTHLLRYRQVSSPVQGQGELSWFD